MILVIRSTAFIISDAVGHFAIVASRRAARVSRATAVVVATGTYFAVLKTNPMQLPYLDVVRYIERRIYINMHDVGNFQRNRMTEIPKTKTTSSSRHMQAHKRASASRNSNRHAYLDVGVVLLLMHLSTFLH
jgi:hypothetical protein